MSTVKYFHFQMDGAPILLHGAGHLIGLLDACLVNGFSARTVNSITVENGVARVLISAGHAYEVDGVIQIGGSSVAALNGDKRVLSATGTELTFAAPGVANTVASGALSARYAPAGWSKPFSGPSLAVYRGNDIEGTRCFLRVDDSVAEDARLVGYESMSDTNTGVGPFPTPSQLGVGVHWPKASSGNQGVPRAWFIVADGRTVWYWSNSASETSTAGGVTFGFGDFRSNKAGDAFSCHLLGNPGGLAGQSSTNYPSSLHHADLSGAVGRFYVPRPYSAIGGSVLCGKTAESYASVDGYSGANSSIAFPNPSDNGLLLSRMLVTELSPTSIRGVFRGPLFIPQLLSPATFSFLNKIEGQGDYVGRKLIAIKSAGIPATFSPIPGTMLFDITGPWA